MAFIPVPNTILVFTEFANANGALYGNTFWVRDEQAGVTAPRVGDCLNIFQTWLSTQKMPSVSNQLSATRLNGRDMSIENGELIDRPLTPPIAGTQVSPLMPANVTIAVSLRTGLAGRSFRGRHYWTGLSEGQVAGDFITTGVNTGILAAINALRVALQAADFTWCIVSRTANGVPRTTGVATAITTVFTVDTRVDTMRRRLLGEGT